MNFLAFWIMVMVIVCSVVAEEERPSDNQVLDGDVDETEGRSCSNCHGGDSSYGHSQGHDQEHSTSQVHQYQDKFHGGGGLEWLWGLGPLALGALPLLALNIVGVVLLALLLKHVSALDSGSSQPIYQPAYAYSTYQGYDGGAANSFLGASGAGPAVGGGGGGGGGGYKKRSTEESRSMADQSTLQFITKLVGNALNKYSHIDAEE